MSNVGALSGKEESADSGDEQPEPVDSLELSPMFGSLMSVAETSQNTINVLTNNWWHIIRKWYPDMLTRIYCVPPVHFYAVTYEPRKLEPKLQEPYERFGMRMFLPVQYTHVVDDEAQQRVLRTLQAFAKKKGLICFILSNVEFQNYLNKSYTVQSGQQDLPKLNRNDEGEVDVLVIDKANGIFILEVKGTGYRHDSTLDQQTKIADCVPKIVKIIKQLPKASGVVRRIMVDLDPNEEIKIRTGFLFPNLQRDVLREALEKHPLHEQNLRNAVGAKTLHELLNCCLCANDLPPKDDPVDTMTDETFPKIDFFWTTLQTVSGEMVKSMEDEIYEQLVARFCGHLSTVKIFTEKTMPRVRLEVIPFDSNTADKKGKRAKKGKKKDKTKVVPFECRTMAGAAREMARRFSELVLLPEQIDLLQGEEDFVHLEGPPGTGKTLMLLLRILTWLDGNNMVWMLSLAPPSRSIIHVLHEQVKQMLMEHKGKYKAEEIIKKRLRIFIMTRPEKTLDAKYFERRLHKWRLRATLKDSEMNWGYPRPPTLPPVAPLSDRKVCLILDETGMTGKGLHAFFDQVALCHKEKCFTSEEVGGYAAGFSVWSASVEKCGRPCYARDPNEAATPEHFGVYRELKIPLRCPPSVQRALMLVQPTLDKNNVFLFQRENVLPNPTPAGVCFPFHADGLPVYLIAHGGHKTPNQPIWLCKECGKDLAIFLKDTLKIGETQPVVSDVPLCQKDVLIVGTQKAYHKYISIGGFFLSMHKKKLKVAISSTREEGDAGLSEKDVILVADITSVHGLERAVVIVVPEVPVSDTTKSTSQDQQVEKMEVDDNSPPDSTSAQQTENTTTENTLMDTQEVNEDDTDDKPDAEMSIVPPDSRSMSPEDTKLKVELQSGSNPASAEESVRSVACQSTGNRGKGPVYVNTQSEREIDAALKTLSDSARRDVFYIGSRAVCQLIIIHFGNGQSGK